MQHSAPFVSQPFSNSLSKKFPRKFALFSKSKKAFLNFSATEQASQEKEHLSLIQTLLKIGRLKTYRFGHSKNTLFFGFTCALFCWPITS
jgi:hypothetical protein